MDGRALWECKITREKAMQKRLEGKSNQCQMHNKKEIKIMHFENCDLAHKMGSHDYTFIARSIFGSWHAVQSTLKKYSQ